MMMAALADSNKNSASETNHTRRIPAWKRLGLTLKFANEHTDQPPQPDSNSSTDEKRPRAQESESRPEETPSDHGRKKRLRLDPPHSPSPKTNGTNVGILSLSVRREGNGIKKTVSFTSDTKVEDGDSSKSLIAGWEAQYDQPSISVNPPKDLEHSKKKSLKSKKPKPTPTTCKPHSALEYLTQYHQSRKTWKFSKNKEIWILKHLFSIDDIPSDYDIALGQYIQGLKSTSARSRIQQAAKEIVQKDREQPIEIVSSEHSDGAGQEVGSVMEDPERRRAYYEDAVKRYKRKLEHHLDDVAEEDMNWVSPERLAKRRRAEITLWATGVTPSSEEVTDGNDLTTSRQSSESRATENAHQANNIKRKRKNRTSIVEVSSSSSEDESSDSSSDDTASEDDEQPEVGLNNSTTTRRSSSSSSDTSSSSSEGSTVSEGSDSESSSSEGSCDDRSNNDRNRLAGKRRVRQQSVISISS